MFIKKEEEKLRKKWKFVQSTGVTSQNFFLGDLNNILVIYNFLFKEVDEIFSFTKLLQDFL